MFCVVYEFHVIPGKEDLFCQAWREMTELIYEFEGSLGSRLHQQSDTHFVAYAQWPSKERWENSGDRLPVIAEKISQDMKDSTLEIKTVYQLESTDDLLASAPFQS
ncbi:antibiotic biosynthesis monooxygenase family protein [Sanyastnella coralliicola]|uniref:antibiotic biosynthesis monooxygenase family protein n=1 Tax=Sanyastnella coralliicola TaxID=3069118 RepID=UPI0027BAB209|nr:antibiotic biosynthesis monooxygenase [Longitalea sp. SCSIO 12813]